MLRRERRGLRAAVRPGGRDRLRRPEPRLPHRRDPAVQGRALPLRERGSRGPPHPARGDPHPERRRTRPAHRDRHRRRILDGRLPRPAPRDLRPRRGVRGPGHGRRLPRRGLHGRDRRGHPRALRRLRPRGPLHRHLRQGARRGERRIRLRPRRDRRAAAAEGPPLPVLQLPRPLDHRGDPAGARARRGQRRAAGDPLPQRGAVPGPDDGGGLRPAPRRARDRARHAGRRGARRAHGRRHARARRLRHRLLLPGRPAGEGADPCAALRRAHRTGRRGRGARLRRRPRRRAGLPVRPHERTRYPRAPVPAPHIRSCAWT